MARTNKLIAMLAPVEIAAAEGDGEKKGPPQFNVTAYTGGAMNLNGWDAPVVVDLAGLAFGNSLIANLDHDPSKRVGHVTGKDKADGKLVLSGLASAATAARDEVVNSAAQGFVWQASIEAQPTRLVEVDAGKTVQVNGQSFDGPLYVARKSTLKGFAFVSHGADDNTSVTIAASAAGSKEINMKAECKAWIEGMGLVLDDLSDTQKANLIADFEGRPSVRKSEKSADGGDIFARRKAERDRREKLRDIADHFCEKHPYDIEAIKAMHDQAIEANMTPDQFKLELFESTIPEGHTVRTPKDPGINARMLEAAVCMAGRLCDDEKLTKMYGEQTLQAAHDRFRSRGISLGQLFMIAAQANGYNAGYGASEVTQEVHNAAFGMVAPHIRASGFSTLSLPNILSNVANKFLREGWMAVDMTPMRIATIRPVRNFQQVTTVSLVGGFEFEQLGPDGEIKHGTASEVTYTNQADTYGKMFAITRRDIINDDLGALTAIPRRIGRGGALKLNNIFWTAFLDNSSFFSSGNANVSTDTGALGLIGLQQADTIFMKQTDPDGEPLGVQPAILLVPTELKTTANQLMTSEKIKGDADEPDGNVWRGRFRVESSPYMSNAAYTGYSASAWYLLADPDVMPVIEIAALNGRVEPNVDTAEAAFNTLGVQMRGYADVGVALQEHRGGVRADGSAAG